MKQNELKLKAFFAYLQTYFLALELLRLQINFLCISAYSFLILARKAGLSVECEFSHSTKKAKKQNKELK